MSNTSTPDAPKVDFGPFQAVGPLKKNSNHYQTDIIEAIASVTPAAQVLFIDLKRTHTIDYGVCRYENSEIFADSKSTAYKLVSRYIVALTKANLIVRIPKTQQRILKLDTNGVHYMLNPYMIRCRRYEEAKVLWKKLTTRYYGKSLP